MNWKRSGPHRFSRIGGSPPPHNSREPKPHSDNGDLRDTARAHGRDGSSGRDRGLDDLAGRSLLPAWRLDDGAIRCSECNPAVDEFTTIAERWLYYSDGCGDVLPYCPACANEFAPDAPASGTASRLHKFPDRQPVVDGCDDELHRE